MSFRRFKPSVFLINVGLFIIVGCVFTYELIRALLADRWYMSAVFLGGAMITAGAVLSRRKATYGRKGDKIVQMNYDAIDAGAKQVVEVEVPESWKDAADEGLATPHIKEGGRADAVAFAKNIQAKVNSQEGNTLPVLSLIHI